MNSYLARSLAEHRAPVEPVKRSATCIVTLRGAVARPAFPSACDRGARTARSSPPATSVSPDLTADGVAVESPDGGPPLADDSLALDAGHTVAWTTTTPTRSHPRPRQQHTMKETP